MTGPGDTVEMWSGKDRHDENFPVGSRLISRPLRPHVHAYYIFARRADDIADSAALPPADKVARLDQMEAVLRGDTDNGSPSSLRLRESLAKTRVPIEHATDLLIAFRQDATKSRYDTIDELYNYCRYSAAPVGRFLLDLHREPYDCRSPSDALCTALQILNHMQDCSKDLRELDRCYLPDALLQHFGATYQDLLGARETPALRRVFVTLLDRIDRLTQAAEELPELARSRGLRMEAATILKLARKLARRLARTDPIAHRVKLSKTDFLFSALGALRFIW